MNDSPIVFLNDEYIPKNKAAISINDRGFHFADGVYEVIKFYKGVPFRFDKHLQRLANSLEKIRIKYYQLEDLESIANNILSQNNLEKEYTGIYVQITRGSHIRMHAFPEKITPTICVEALEMKTRQENLQNGIKVITRPDIRWLRCDIKSVSLLGNILMIQEAVENNAKECILVRDGVVTEATHSNVLGVKDGKVFTHPDSNLILPGITKEAIKDICVRVRIEFIEDSFSEKDIYSFNELFVSGTGNEIMPVVQVNDTVIGDRKPGPLTRRIQKYFFEMTYGKLAEDYWWK